MKNRININTVYMVLSLIFIIPFTCYIEQVRADDTTITGNIGSGSSSGVSGYYDALWSGHLYEFEFRVTLVDADGEKVQDTNSVDYGYNNDPKTYQLTGNELTNKMRTAIGYNYSNNTYNYEYKYGTNTDNYSYYKVKLVNGNYYNYYSQYETFVQEFQMLIKNRTKQFGIADNTTGNFDFLTMFLYHCGYLNSDDGNYYDIDDNKWQSKKIDIATNNYFLLIEPMFTISGTYSKHGTSNEMAKFLLSTGTVPYGLMGSFTYTIGMGMNTDAQEIQKLEFNRVKYGDRNLSLSIFKKGGASNAQVINEWQITSNPEYGYGIGVLSISTEIIEIGPPDGVPVDIYYSENYCSQTSNENNTGKMLFNIGNNLDENLFTKLEKSGMKFRKSNSSNGDVYCYDNVTYDFGNAINTLNMTTAKLATNVTIPTGTLTVNRKCKINSPNVEYDTIKTTFLNNFEEYENQNIPLTVYNKTIGLKKIDISKAENESNLKTIIGNKKGIYNVTAIITFGYTENNSKVYVDKNSGTGTASVDLSNATFGYSNDLKKQIEDGQTYTYDIYTFNTHVTSNTENYVCKFKTPIENPPTTPEKYTTPDIQFRTIDLDNPFPARDGSSRLPGTNWLGKDNYVRAYISYNRGVEGNEVYNKEPIYTITLTPTNMLRIREYNKLHDYNEINNELVCTGENKTACLSPFLASNQIIELDKKDGTCSAKNLQGSGLSLSSDPNGIKNANIDELVDNITEIYDNNDSVFTYDYSDAQLKLDFNNDKILTLRDAYIYDTAEKTTTFYTCADKTYENSGYIRKEQ